MLLGIIPALVDVVKDFEDTTGAASFIVCRAVKIPFRVHVKRAKRK